MWPMRAAAAAYYRASNCDKHLYGRRKPVLPAREAVGLRDWRTRVMMNFANR